MTRSSTQLKKGASSDDTRSVLNVCAHLEGSPLSGQQGGGLGAEGDRAVLAHSDAQLLYRLQVREVHAGRKLHRQRGPQRVHYHVHHPCFRVHRQLQNRLFIYLQVNWI